ncbi:MAG: DHHW family protein [Muribaculum sp.]|nr:DHHW family protein [Muribaculum sp.]
MEEITETEWESTPKKGHGASRMYIWIVGTVFAVLTIVFVFFPRSKYSELEKRDLTEFPDISEYGDKPGKFTSAVASWFSDTEPYRDELMTLSMGIRNAMRGDILPDEETVSFRPAAPQPISSETKATDVREPATDNESKQDSISEELPDIEDGNAKLGDSGTIIVGKGDKVRALMAFGGTAKGGGGYVDLLNTLAETFPAQQVYAMIAPLATEFYLPAKASKASNPQKPFIYSVRDRLSPKVKFVDVYDELSKHTSEDIYLRTDHHWAGLGGYYAAKRLAQTAGVPFKGLDAYDKHVLKNFVGSMYGYSKDIAVKNAPEDFVYYTPNQVQYDAEYVAYTLNKNFQIVKESKPYKSSLFKKFKDGSGSAYLTFVGSDQVFVKVKTSTPGNRKLLIIKDSYGNAVPGNLLYSFNEVHVIDFRYFTHNLKEYVANNGITDIAVCFNVFNAYSSGSASKVKKMISQKGGVHTSPKDPAPATPRPRTDATSSQPQTETASPPISETSETTDIPETSETSETSKNPENSVIPEDI